MLEYFLLSRLSTHNFAYDIIIILFFIPMVTYSTNFIKNELPSILEKWRLNKWNRINFVGWDHLSCGVMFFDYPEPMLAICHHITTNNFSSNIRYINSKRNSIFYTDSLEKIDKNNINYIVDNQYNIKIKDDIYIDFLSNPINTKNDSNNSNTLTWKVSLIVKSKNFNQSELKEFINTCMKNYLEFEKNKNNNKIFHFIYQGISDEKLKFSQNLFSDFKKEEDKNNETFNSLFSEHKDNIIKAVNRLKNYEYYKRTGNKRKLGYLFHGNPGCGKTAHVAAIANLDKRHILEVPMSRVKTNKELEEIINLTQINDVLFKKENLIIFFDEIDQVGKTLSKRSNEVDEEKEPIFKSQNKDKEKEKDTFNFLKNDDELNLGNILSRLDGIGNYNGLIIIAATNCIDKLSPALYRSGRLTSLHFDFCRKIDIIGMIEFYYQIKLSKDEITYLPDRKHNISPATIKKYMEEHENNYKELLSLLKTKIN